MLQYFNIQKQYGVLADPINGGVSYNIVVDPVDQEQLKEALLSHGEQDVESIDWSSWCVQVDKKDGDIMAVVGCCRIDHPRFHCLCEMVGSPDGGLQFDEAEKTMFLKYIKKESEAVI